MAPRTRSKTGDTENEPSHIPLKSIKTPNMAISSQTGSSTRGEAGKKTIRAPLASIAAPNPPSPLEQVIDELGSLRVTFKDPKDALIAALQEKVVSLERELREERHQTPFNFPSELHDYILGLADTASLVKAARVNKEFWEFAQKHLYTHVKINDVESLALLFRERESVLYFPMQDGRFVPSCSLNHIRTLTIELNQLLCDTDASSPYLHLPPNYNPLPIDLLQVTSNPHPKDRSSSRINQSLLLPHLLNVVDPSEVNFRTPSHLLLAAISVIDRCARSWTRIHHLEVTKSVDSVVSFGSTRTSSGAPLTFEYQSIESEESATIANLASIVLHNPGLAGGTVLLVRSEEVKIRWDWELERVAKGTLHHPDSSMRAFGGVIGAVEVRLAGMTVA